MLIFPRSIPLNDNLELEAFNLTKNTVLKEFMHIYMGNIVKCVSITVPKVEGYAYEYVSTYSRVPNRSAVTFIFLGGKILPVRAYKDLHVY